MAAGALPPLVAMLCREDAPSLQEEALMSVLNITAASAAGGGAYEALNPNPNPNPNPSPSPNPNPKPNPSQALHCTQPLTLALAPTLTLTLARRCTGRPPTTTRHALSCSSR